MRRYYILVRDLDRGETYIASQDDGDEPSVYVIQRGMPAFEDENTARFVCATLNEAERLKADERIREGQ